VEGKIDMLEIRWVASVLGNVEKIAEEELTGSFSGVSIDTRADCSGKLFFALRGNRHDGHDYVEDAIGGGARGIVVEERWVRGGGVVSGDVPVFIVDDTLKALQRLATEYRKKISPGVIAITGSTGKTTTKEFVFSVLSIRYRVHATPGNLNNHIGLPLTILQMVGNEELLVTEMGASSRGEIKRLCEIAAPQLGAITNIAEAALEFVKTLKGVARAKAELVENLAGDGTAILPADSEFFDYLKERSTAPVISFGYVDTSDYRVSSVEVVQGRCRFKVNGTQLEIPFPGRHNILNAAVAFVVGKLFKLSDDEIARGIKSAKQVKGRGEVMEIGGITIIDDTYNSNPASLKAAVEMLMDMEIEGARWVVLGDMLELGEESKSLHQEAGVLCGKAGIDGLLTIGDETVELNRAAATQRKAPPVISHFLDPVKLARFLNEHIKPGDCVLVKGSRGMKMEVVIEELKSLRSDQREKVE